MLVKFNPTELFEMENDIPNFSAMSSINIGQKIRDIEFDLITKVLDQIYKRPLTNLDYLNCERIYNDRDRYQYKLFIERVYVGDVINHAFDLSSTIATILTVNSSPVIFEFIPSSNYR